MLASPVFLCPHNGSHHENHVVSTIMWLCYFLEEVHFLRFGAHWAHWAIKKGICMPKDIKCYAQYCRSEEGIYGIAAAIQATLTLRPRSRMSRKSATIKAGITSPTISRTSKTAKKLLSTCGQNGLDDEADTSKCGFCR